jgi:NADH dehydrogenase
MKANIEETNLKRVVIVGAGFGGLKLARLLSGKEFQVVLIDKYNYHQFQPLYYQVATSGLEPSAISFPLRKVFQGEKNTHIRITELKAINSNENYIETTIGKINYDFLIVATGTTTNFFGNQRVMENAMPMKSVGEALGIRNRILENYEVALATEDKDERQALMNIVVVGGGPTGVEVSGTLAEMKKHILPKDYPELDFSKMQISLVEMGSKLLSTMSEVASKKSLAYLKKLGVTVQLGISVKDYDGTNVILSNNTIVKSKTLIWAAGVTGTKIEGLPPEVIEKGNRIKVDKHNLVVGTKNIYAIGDIATMIDEKYPKGHPQLAQPAMQQAKNLANNLRNILKNKPLTAFHYKDPGSLATVGRNLAIADLPYIKFQGFLAWIVWMFVHLMSIVGVKNRLIIFINWAWNYISYDQSLRLILRPENDRKMVEPKPELKREVPEEELMHSET